MYCFLNYLYVYWPQDTFTRAKKWVQELQRQGEGIKIEKKLIMHFLFLFLFNYENQIV